MTSTHAVQPLSAFDMHGNSIPPTEYDRALRGASAHIRFSISKYSWRTGDNRKDTFVADLEMIRVITPPRPRIGPFSNRKRVHKTDVYTPDVRPKTRQRMT